MEEGFEAELEKLSFEVLECFREVTIEYSKRPGFGRQAYRFVRILFWGTQVDCLIKPGVYEHP